jgi:peptide deformylase
MSVLQIVYAPNDIFRKKAEQVGEITHEVRKIVNDMIDTMNFERAVGLGANMVGILRRIAVIDLKENGISEPLCLINPEIIWSSEETQTFNEASLSFPGISAEVTRPRAIKVRFIDYDGAQQEVEFDGFLATVIQHEVDYLDGKIFLDYVSKIKREMLLKKMQKHLKMHPPHVHGVHCHH